MKKSFCIAAAVFLLLLAGCSAEPPDASEEASPSGNGSASVMFLSGMGCSDRSCTDASHYHDCPADCADYDHYHSCTLDCAEAQHHHAGKAAVSGHGSHHDDKHH